MGHSVAVSHPGMMGRLPFAGLAAIVVSLAVTGAAAADLDRVRGCMSPEQAHELLIQQKFVAPFRALREATHGGQGEAVGVELCRQGETFVYDVTVLQRDGHVGHVLVNARTGLQASTHVK